MTRGMVAHEARSQLRLYRDAAGCESIQTVNRQFRPVTLTTPSGPQLRVLEEQYDVRRCRETEGISSEAVVTAWLPDSGQTRPLFRISGRGVAGAPAGNLYQMVTFGCCGSRPLAMYHSLHTGTYLFSSTVPLRGIRSDTLGGVRYAAFHDSFSASDPSERATDSTVIGVLQWGDDRTAADRVVVHTASPGRFAATQLGFVQGGRRLEDSIAVASGTQRDPVILRIDLEASGSARRLRLEFVVQGDSLVTTPARAPDGITVSRGDEG